LLQLPRSAQADARESGEETAAQFGSAQSKEGEEGASQCGAGLEATGRTGKKVSSFFSYIYICFPKLISNKICNSF
jgi:hypothetical protein